MLFVHGPGGIGKSALLRRFAEQAVAAGRTVIPLDGRTMNPTPRAFEAAAAAASHDARAVLLVDTFELVQGLEGWLRERFLPGLPTGALVVLAGRMPPDLCWRADPGWAGTLEVLRLGELSREEARELLEAGGVRAGLREPLLSFAGGNPLALRLGAAVAAADERAGRRWTPSHDLIVTLLDQLVGAPPTPAHRRALDVCAHAHMTTEELLRAALPGDDATALFAWLRRLPFVERSTLGLYPHDVVRELLETDLRRRAPDGYAEMRRRIHDHLIRRIRTAPDSDVLAATASLTFPHRHNPLTATVFTSWRSHGEVQEDVFTDGDLEELLRVAASESRESADTALFWVRRQPAAFRAYRLTKTGEAVAFRAWLRLHVPDEDEIGADPIVAAAWAHARATDPLRPGEHIALSRPWLLPSYRGRSPVMDLIQWRVIGDWTRSSGLAWSYSVRHDPDAGGEFLRQYDITEVPQRPRVGDNEYGLFAQDWRRIPAQVWLERLIDLPPLAPRDTAGPSSAPLTVLSMEEFHGAVRKALRSLSRPAGLAANPLTRTRLVSEHPGDDPAAALRDLLVQAIADLRDDPRARKPYRAVEVTFLRGAPSQSIAAELLGLPFTTYRRHLTTGVRRICESLWRRELFGDDQT
ncbi:COG2256: ATPase related to the helicase subunit of the Holliday junction resolvase [[Actinomadura] parvosata subsp. kistnae]|nr:COG2256: ATPase related to the helicase subunit of the Holliday junction resolvase [Actinomadura parvosata subsp. kistnae]